jgi:type VI secretion system protein ImpD/type VI secretion system protein ImpC
MDAEPGLRKIVLGGGFTIRPSGAALSALAAFLASPGAGLSSWFGSPFVERFDREQTTIRCALDRDIAAIDGLISRQLDEILHAPRLLRLEGMWRGLHWLIEGIEPRKTVKLRILPARWEEVARDLDRAVEFDQSYLFRRIYTDEFGMPGGEPYGLLVIDHEVRHRPSATSRTDDTSAMLQIAAIAAASFCPTILAASPALLGADVWSDLATTQDPTSTLGDKEHARWQRLSEEPDMRFLGVVLPRLLARPAWQDDPARRDGFRYVEHTSDSTSRVWMSAGYAFAANAIRAFTTFAWPADIRGVDADRSGGGLVTDLPAETFSSERAAHWPRTPVEVIFSDQQERSLVSAGLMPVNGMPFTNDAAFIALRSLQVPARYIGVAANDANANARISAQFNAMLCVSRFGHYIKIIGRDMAGSFKTEDEIERGLQKWLQQYVNTSALSSGPESRARAPLSKAELRVREVYGKPGSFGCTIHLQPHYQLDDVAATFSLTTDFRAPGSQ